MDCLSQYRKEGTSVIHEAVVSLIMSDPVLMIEVPGETATGAMIGLPLGFCDSSGLPIVSSSICRDLDESKIQMK